MQSNKKWNKKWGWHYNYFGKLKFSEDPEQRKWAESVRLVFPNQAEGDRGAHVNISGGGVAKFSKNKAEAQQLLEFLTSEKAQKLYGEINFEAIDCTLKGYIHNECDEESLNQDG